MIESDILKKLSEDMHFLKNKIARLEIAVGEIDSDIHREVNPAYLRKLRTIEREGTITKREFEKKFKVKI